MSIINEALKKAGQPVELRSAISRKKNRINWGPFFVMSVLILIVSPIIAPAFHNPYYNEAPVPPASPVVSAPIPEASHEPKESTMKEQFVVEEVPIVPMPVLAKPVAPPEPDFLLNGIMFSKAQSYALINGKVVRIGESVDGATLIKVTDEQAVLDYGGREIVLSAN